MKKFKELREHSLEEKLKASDPAGTYISDFVHSDNPKFAGKSKSKRIQMALAASYAAKGKSRNEEVESLDEGKMQTMTLSGLWHKHAQHTHWADQGHGQGSDNPKHSDSAATAIENHVRKVHGNKVADDMVDHSNHHVAYHEYAGPSDSEHHEKAMAKLKGKHGITESVAEGRNDTPVAYGSLSNRPSSATVAQTGPRKGMITKKHATRLKDRIKSNLNKEEVESVEEGIMNAVKNLAAKAGKALTGGSDEDQRKDLQRKMGVPQTGKKPTQK